MEPDHVMGGGQPYAESACACLFQWVRFKAICNDEYVYRIPNPKHMLRYA